MDRGKMNRNKMGIKLCTIFNSLYDKFTQCENIVPRNAVLNSHTLALTLLCM